MRANVDSLENAQLNLPISQKLTQCNWPLPVTQFLEAVFFFFWLYQCVNMFFLFTPGFFIKINTYKKKAPQAKSPQLDQQVELDKNSETSRFHCKNLY